jgi:hypothetical protein
MTESSALTFFNVDTTEDVGLPSIFRLNLRIPGFIARSILNDVHHTLAQLVEVLVFHRGASSRRTRLRIRL